MLANLQAALVPFSSTNQCELSVLVDGYNQALASTLNQHAPLKTKKVVYECYQPWYCSMIGDAIRNCRKLERKWRANVNCKEKWAAFDIQRKLTQEIIKKKEKEYYHQLFIEKATNPKEVFSIANALLARNSISPLPECSSLMELANDFNIFAKKIVTIRDNIINTQFNGVKPTPIEPVNETVTLEMNSFSSVPEGDVKKRICKLPSKSCELDPMPTTLLKQMVKVVTPVITCIINRSLLSVSSTKV